MVLNSQLLENTNGIVKYKHCDIHVLLTEPQFCVLGACIIASSSALFIFVRFEAPTASN